MNWWISTLLGCAVGIVGTMLGALLVAPIKRPGDQLPGLMMGLSGGIMLSIVCCDMIPEGLEKGGFWTMLAGVVSGMLIMAALHIWIKRPKKKIVPVRDEKKTSMMQTGFLLLAGIGLHNFPEGLAVGTGLAQGVNTFSNFGIRLAILITLHDIPEGVALAVPFKLAGKSSLRVIALGVLAGLPTGLGAVLGYLLGAMSPAWIAYAISLAGGAMLFITFWELVPEALHAKSWKMSMVAIAVGLLVGTLLVWGLSE